MPWLTIHQRSNNSREFRDVVAADDDSDQCHALNETAEYKSPEFPHVSILIPLANECDGTVHSQPHECSLDILVREL